MIFYCGYILGVYPAVLIAQRYRAGKVCAGLIFAWAVVEILYDNPFNTLPFMQTNKSIVQLLVLISEGSWLNVSFLASVR